jgi:hypothetical protein
MERLKVENNMCFGSNDRTSSMAIDITINKIGDLYFYAED